MRDGANRESQNACLGSHTYTHHTGKRTAVWDSPFAHLGGFPTAGALPIPLQTERKRMIELIV